MLMLLGLLRPAGAIMGMSLKLPVWLLLAAGAWLWFDRESSIREAVDSAVTNLVAGAELEAATAKAAGLDLLNANLRRRAAQLQVTSAEFSTSLDEAEQDLRRADETLAELADQALDACVVDERLGDRLQHRR